MEKQNHDSRLEAFINFEIPYTVAVSEITTPLRKSIDVQTSRPISAVEDLILEFSHDEKSTSTKISNINFRLWDFLIETNGIGGGMAKPDIDLVDIVIGAIRFIREMRELSKVEVKRKEAAILLALFRFQVEKQEVTLDRLIEVLIDMYPEEQILDSLITLEKLSCIEYTLDGIKLIENIVPING